MPDLVRHILGSPRTWLSIGAFCIGTSFLIGYHLDQRSADRVLAQKVGKPQEVLVQNFIPDLHKNMINGVHVLGQMSDDECIKVNIGTDSEPRWITVRPIYAVGPELLPVAKQHLRAVTGERARPVPRSASERLRRERIEIAGISGMALAFVIEEVIENADGAETPSALATIGGEDTVRLVEVVGSEVTGSDLRNTVSKALLDNGTPSVPDSLLIAPATMATHAPTDDTAVAALRRWLAVIGVLLAIVAMAAPRLQGFVASRSRRPAAVQVVEAHGSFPAVGAFQPIVSQDELALDEERVLSESSPGTQIRRRMSRLTEFAASGFGGVKSPR